MLGDCLAVGRLVGSSCFLLHPLFFLGFLFPTLSCLLVFFPSVSLSLRKLSLPEATRFLPFTLAILPRQSPCGGASQRPCGAQPLARVKPQQPLSKRVTYRGGECSSCLLRQGAGIPCSPAGCTKASAVRLLLEPLPKLFGGAEAFLAPSVEVNLYRWREGGGCEESARQAVCKEDGCRGQPAAGDGGCTRTLSPSWPPCPACALPSLSPHGAAPRRSPKLTRPCSWATGSK